jgi:hypothetical protein
MMLAIRYMPIWICRSLGSARYQSLPPRVSSVGRIQRSSVGSTAKSGESQVMSLKASKCWSTEASDSVRRVSV